MKREKHPGFFKELNVFMRPYVLQYGSSILLSILSVLCELSAYALVGKMAGELISGGNEKKILISLIFVVISKFASVLFMNASAQISHKAAYLTLKDLRNAICDKFLRLPMGYFDKHSSGRLKTTVVDRVEDIEKTLAHLLPEMTANLLIPVLMILWMFLLHVKLTAIILAWIVFGLGIGMGMMVGYEKKYEGQVSVQKNMNQAVVEYVKGIEVIKAFQQGEGSYRKYERAVAEHAAYAVDWMKSSQLYASSSYSIAPVSIFPAIVAGLLFLHRGELTEPDLFLFMMFSFGIFHPIVKASRYFDQVAQMGTVAREIREILEYPELKRRATSNLRRGMNYHISFQEVCFSYDGVRPVIDGVNLEIEEKSVTAVIGHSGSGKSTLMKLLAGFWDFESGEIQIGGVSVKDYSMDDLNRLISYVDQQAFLFEESIFENIRIGKKDATKEEVMEAAKRAGCHDFISRLPRGYDTVAGDRLSGGEKQRIAIARAILKDSPIVILDEATASADVENEEKLQQALAEVTKNKTLIVITHKVNTVFRADQIVYMEHGKVGACGTHEELLQSCPSYEKMCELLRGSEDYDA